MTPCPCSPHFKMTPLRTVASIARWKEMMSQKESSRAPESSHQPSPMPVSQVTNPPSSSHQASTHPKKKKRKTRFLQSRRWIVYLGGESEPTSIHIHHRHRSDRSYLSLP
ncbi:hypothetical protein LINGRAHAP2_LOCUS37188, partial [Linum grandiflorum]